jgi:hypothetical protein
MSDDPLSKVTEARQRLDDALKAVDAAKATLYAAMHTAFDAGNGPSAVGRAAGFTREHAANIKNWKVKDDHTPR